MKLSRPDWLHLDQARLLGLVAQSGAAQQGVAQWCYPRQLSSLKATSAPAQLPPETESDKSPPRPFRFNPARSNLALSQESSTDPLYALDPKIEITLRRLRKARNIVVSGSSNSVSKLEQMENNDRTLKELATPDVVYQPWCIQYPRRPPQALEGIPCCLFHNEAVGDTGRLHQNEGVSILPGWSSKRLVPVLFNTWGDMKHMFLEKFFPTSRTATIRKEICGIRQHPGETLHEYWERFNKLCATCPHHQISEQLLI
ncbi:hypothetical protein CR513_16997, partial [Mucuna pruriens]